MWVLKNEEQLTEAREAEGSNPWRCGCTGHRLSWEKEGASFPPLLPFQGYSGLSKHGGTFAVRSYSC